MIKITVATVTYNAESVLRRTVDSVKSQDYPLVEHLIIDGASKDGTLRIARDYAREVADGGGEHEVRIVSEPDAGLYDAMNKALRLATGHYIVFINAGDSLHDASTLSRIVASTGADGERVQDASLPAVVYGDTDIVDDGGRFMHRRAHRPPEHLTWRSFRQGMLVCHQAFYALTDIARAVPYDMRYRHSADVDWCIRVMKEADRRGLTIVNARAVVADYLSEGHTTANHGASLRERFGVMRRHYGLAVTVVMHAWFAARAVWRLMKSLLSFGHRSGR